MIFGLISIFVFFFFFSDYGNFIVNIRRENQTNTNLEFLKLQLTNQFFLIWLKEAVTSF